MKIEKLKVGDIVYSVERRNMGNTTIRTTSVFSVKIAEINLEKRWVMASWNSNPPQKFYRSTISKWKAKKPVTVDGIFGSQRLATRAEIKAMEEAKNAHNGG